jgi:hypothetical protein
MNMSFARACLSATGCVLVLLGSGCSGKLVKVQGVVLLDGKPLPRAGVLFIPEGSEGRDANGFTDDNGVFRLTTFRPGDGALPGTYKVVIQYSEEAAIPAHLNTPEAIQKAMGKTIKPPKPSLTIPPTYSQPDRTILRQQVPPNGEVKFELRSDNGGQRQGGSR